MDLIATLTLLIFIAVAVYFLIVNIPQKGPSPATAPPAAPPAAPQAPHAAPHAPHAAPHEPPSGGPSSKYAPFCKQSTFQPFM